MIEILTLWHFLTYVFVIILYLNMLKIVNIMWWRFWSINGLFRKYVLFWYSAMEKGIWHHICSKVRNKSTDINPYYNEDCTVCFSAEVTYYITVRFLHSHRNVFVKTLLSLSLEFIVFYKTKLMYFVKNPRSQTDLSLSV